MNNDLDMISIDLNTIHLFDDNNVMWNDLKKFLNDVQNIWSMSNENIKTYFINFNNKYNDTLLNILIKIINDSNLIIYHEICMIVIYKYFNNDIIEHIDNNQLTTLLDNASTIINKKYKNNIFKLILAFLHNINHENFINKNFIYDTVNISINTSYNNILYYFDYLFAELINNLITCNLINFKNKFDILLKKYYDIFDKGYIDSYIKINIAILYKVAYNRKLLNTCTTIWNKFPNFDSSSFISNINNDKNSYLFIVYNNNLSNNDLQIINKINNILNTIDSVKDINVLELINKLTNKKIIFRRRTLKDTSIFEKLLINHINIFNIRHIINNILYNYSNFHEIIDILTIKNPLNKTIFEYILDTKNDEIIVDFLRFEFIDINNKHQSFMVIKNMLYYDYSKSNLITFHFNIIDSDINLQCDNNINMINMFEDMSNNSNFEYNIDNYIIDLFDKVISEKVIDFDSNKEPTLPCKHYWISIIICYWKKEAMIKFKNTSIPIFNILYNIITQNIYKLSKQSLINLENSFSSIYKIPRNHNISYQNKSDNNIFNYYEKYIAHYLFVCMFAGIKTNNKEIIDSVFNYANMLNIIPIFPNNMEFNEIQKYVIIKMIKNRYEIGRDVFPPGWLSLDVINDIIKLNIDNKNSDTIKLDYGFMLPYYSDINNSNDEFNEDYETLSYLNNKVNPIINNIFIKIYVKIKYQKYKIFDYLNNFIILLFTLCTLSICLLYYFQHIHIFYILLLNNLRLLIIFTKTYFIYKIIYRYSDIYIYKLLIIYLLIINGFICLCIYVPIITKPSVYLLEIINILISIYFIIKCIKIDNVVNNINTYLYYSENIRIYFAIHEINPSCLDMFIIKILKKCLLIYSNIHNNRIIYIDRSTGYVYTDIFKTIHIFNKNNNIIYKLLNIIFPLKNKLYIREKKLQELIALSNDDIYYIDI